MTKLDALLTQFEKAINRLQDALNQEKNEFMRDSSIQRFEFTFDLSWKLVKSYLEDRHGIVVASPKSCFREAYKQKLIKYDDLWIEMTEMRNLTVHTYKEELAEEIYNKLPKLLENFQQLLKAVK